MVDDGLPIGTIPAVHCEGSEASECSPRSTGGQKKRSKEKTGKAVRKGTNETESKREREREREHVWERECTCVRQGWVKTARVLTLDTAAAHAQGHSVHVHRRGRPQLVPSQVSVVRAGDKVVAQRLRHVLHKRAQQVHAQAKAVNHRKHHKEKGGHVKERRKEAEGPPDRHDPFQGQRCGWSGSA